MQKRIPLIYGKATFLYATYWIGCEVIPTGQPKRSSCEIESAELQQILLSIPKNIENYLKNIVVQLVSLEGMTMSWAIKQNKKTWSRSFHSLKTCSQLQINFQNSATTSKYVFIFSLEVRFIHQKINCL